MSFVILCYQIPSFLCAIIHLIRTQSCADAPSRYFLHESQKNSVQSGTVTVRDVLYLLCAMSAFMARLNSSCGNTWYTLDGLSFPRASKDIDKKEKGTLERMFSFTTVYILKDFLFNTNEISSWDDVRVKQLTN